MSKVPESLSNGRYRIDKILGVGGMSVVMRAEDTRMGVPRAIKLLHRRFANDPSLRRRFENEAHAQAALRHPNILMVHDVADEEAGAYLVMELAEGGSLSQRVRATGPIPPKEVAEIGIVLAGALSVAHAAGVVHRDIKPDNVLVDHLGTLKLADFGIARVLKRDSGLTRTGTVMGTWAYMPPEQRADTKDVDGRADIYSLGATLYFLASGKAPFHLHNIESHAEAFEGFPPPLAAVIQMATRFDFEQRYPHCEAMVAALMEIRDQLPDQALARPPELELHKTIAPSEEDLSTILEADLAPLGGSAGQTAVPSSERSIIEEPSRPGHTFRMGDTGSLAIAPPEAASPRGAVEPTSSSRLPLLLGSLIGLIVVALTGLLVVPRLIPREVTPLDPPVVAQLPVQVAPPPVEHQPIELPPSENPEEPDAPPATDPGKAPKDPGTKSTAGQKTSTPRVITIAPVATAATETDATGASADRPEAPSGTVVVKTVPTGATVKEGGATLSRSGRGYRLSVGNHILEIVSQNGEKTTVPVVLRANETVDICYSFDSNSACAP